MGAVASVIIPAAVTGVVALFRALSSSPTKENPTETSIRERGEAERRTREAEAADRRAREEAERIRQEHQAAMDAANRVAEEARREREAAERRRAEQEEAMRHMREQAERERREQEDAMRNMREQAARERYEQEEAARAAREEARRAREEQEAAMHANDEAVARANEQHEAALRAVEAASRQALVAQEEAVRAAKEELDNARRAERQVVKQLMEGVRPEVWPTTQDLMETKRKRQYVEGRFHFAVAGISGSGKSSLINGFLGRRNGGATSAATGVVETTSEIGRYPDPNPDHRPFIWYDIPGAGTINISDWQYFNDQGLYIFDCIIVLFDNRFTATDIAILKNCTRFKIPSYIVRSKSNQHIRNIALDMGYEDDDVDEVTRREILDAAKNTYVNETRQSVRRNLKTAGLPPHQKVYMVSNSGLYSVISLRPRGLLIDEVQLVEDILKEGHARRCT